MRLSRGAKQALLAGGVTSTRHFFESLQPTELSFMDLEPAVAQEAASQRAALMREQWPSLRCHCRRRGRCCACAPAAGDAGVCAEVDVDRVVGALLADCDSHGEGLHANDDLDLPWTQGGDELAGPSSADNADDAVVSLEAGAMTADFIRSVFVIRPRFEHTLVIWCRLVIALSRRSAAATAAAAAAAQELSATGTDEPAAIVAAPPEVDAIVVHDALVANARAAARTELGARWWAAAVRQLLAATPSDRRNSRAINSNNSVVVVVVDHHQLRALLVASDACFDAFVATAAVIAANHAPLVASRLWLDALLSVVVVVSPPPPVGGSADADDKHQEQLVSHFPAPSTAKMQAALESLAPNAVHCPRIARSWSTAVCALAIDVGATHDVRDAVLAACFTFSDGSDDSDEFGAPRTPSDATRALWLLHRVLAFVECDRRHAPHAPTESPPLVMLLRPPPPPLVCGTAAARDALVALLPAVVVVVDATAVGVASGSAGAALLWRRAMREVAARDPLLVSVSGRAVRAIAAAAHALCAATPVHVDEWLRCVMVLLHGQEARVRARCAVESTAAAMVAVAPVAAACPDVARRWCDVMMLLLVSTPRGGGGAGYGARETLLGSLRGEALCDALVCVGRAAAAASCGAAAPTNGLAGAWASLVGELLVASDDAGGDEQENDDSSDCDHDFSEMDGVVASRKRALQPTPALRDALVQVAANRPLALDGAQAWIIAVDKLLRRALPSSITESSSVAAAATAPADSLCIGQHMTEDLAVNFCGQENDGQKHVGTDKIER